MKTKRILFEGLEKEANYLAGVFGISTEDVFTEDEIAEAKEKGYIDLVF